MSNYLEQYDAAAEADKFPLVRRWLDTEALPFFQELREHRPILVTPQATLLARFDDVTEVLNLPKIFTVELYVPKMADYLMAHDDDAVHSRDKAIMQSLLNRDDLPKVRKLVAAIANATLDQAQGRLEVAYGYCREVPAGLVQQYFGLTGSQRKDLIEWSYWNQYDTFHNQPFDLLSDEKRKHIETRHQETGDAMGAYIKKLIIRRLIEVKLGQLKDLALLPWKLAQKRLNPQAAQPSEGLSDDIVARMLKTSYPKEVDFDIKRLGLNAGGLLIGAIETTSQVVAQAIQFLIDRPELLAQAVEAAKAEDTAKFDGMVWEAIRFVPLSPYFFRKAASTYTVAKGSERATTITPGTYVLPLVQSAMFDPRAFESPEEFIAERNWYHYFHFGFGSHECLGKYVGMVMIPEMVRQILLRPGIHALAPINYQSGPFPERYELAWNAA